MCYSICNIFVNLIATDSDSQNKTKAKGVKLDGKSIWKFHMDFFFHQNLFFLICLDTYKS